MPVGHRPSGLLPRAVRVVVTGTVLSGMALGAGALASLPASASRVPAPQRIGVAPRAGAGATRLGALPGTTKMQVDVELLPRNPAALASFATAVSTPGNPLYRHYIDTAQFAKRFGPTSTAVRAVEKQLAADGIKVGKLAADHLTLPVTGKASIFAKAFSTRFVRYRMPDGRVVYANTAAPLFGGTTARYIEDVVGLDNLTLPHPINVAQAPTHPR